MNNKINQEKEENDLYKKYIQEKLKKDENSFCTFRREKQLDHIFAVLEPLFEEKNLKILDLCCGYGRLLYFLNEFDRKQFYHGIDYTKELIERGNDIFHDVKNISFEERNAYDISSKYSKHFDISILHKTLSWLPYYENIIPELIKVTKKKIIITSLFWDKDVDFILKIHENVSIDNSSFIYTNTYSLPHFIDFCLKSGAKKVSSRNMNLDINLPYDEDELLPTYTIKVEDGRNLEFTGVTQLHWKLIEIDL